MESPKFINIFENKEQVRIETKILSADELLEIIYKGKSIPQDSRFFPLKEGGVFKYFDPRDIASIGTFTSKKLFPVVFETNKIIGLSELEQDPKDDKNLWIKFVSVDPAFQDKGYASKLLRQIFNFAKENGYTLEPSFYSEQGMQKLKSSIEKMSNETGVKLANQ